MKDDDSIIVSTGLSTPQSLDIAHNDSTNESDETMIMANDICKIANARELNLIASITGRVNKETVIDRMAYTFCVLDKLQSVLKRRDVFISPSWRYADPRANLPSGAEWAAMLPIAQAIAEIGRIDKTIHMLNYINDESFDPSTLLQLNLGEGRHA